MEKVNEKKVDVFIPSAGELCACSSPKPTCKLPVAVATVTKPGDELAIELEDEDAAGLVVHHDDVAVPVYGDAFRAHQLPRADLILEKSSNYVGE